LKRANGVYFHSLEKIKISFFRYNWQDFKKGTITREFRMAASYDETNFEKLYRVEDRHFWFRTRQAIVAALCQSFVPNLPANYRVLEIGCGTGQLLKTLQANCSGGQVFGLDLFWEGLAFARQRSTASLIQGRAETMPFNEGQFDLIGMFDVLEHLENDEAILHSVERMLKPGGKLILTVPAGRRLWSTTDLVARHQRRYEPEELNQKLQNSGLQVEYLSEFMQALYPLARLRPKAPLLLEDMSAEEERKSRRKFGQELMVLPVVNEIAYLLLSTEVRKIRRYQPIRRGTSLIAVASRSQP